MTFGSQRFILWLVAVLLIIPLLIKGHCSSRNKGTAVAFSHSSTVQIIVRIKGSVPSPGIYRFHDGTTIAGVINMTIAGSIDKVKVKAAPGTLLKSGDIICLRPNDNGKLELSIGYMGAKELMVLGIPLQPDLLTVDDWDALPGIGPELAKRIVFDRQINGDFSSVNALNRVPGIAEGKIEQIREYFTRR